MSFLNLTVSALAFDDATSSNNPQLLRPAWRRSWPGVPVEKPQAQEYDLDPLEEVTVFNGARTLTADASTAYALANVPALDPSRYRLTWTGAGAAPGFRTARAVTTAGGNLILALNANQTLSATHSAGAVFGDVVVGAEVLIPGTRTGDTGPFDPLNEGLWLVLTAAAGALTLSRATGTVFSGASETVAIAANTEFQAFAPGGVQVGDMVDIKLGFSTSARRAYEITAVTASRLEFTSTTPLGDETAVPGVAGLAVYSAAKRYVYLEADQEVALKYNGATDSGNRVTPLLAGDPLQKGFDMKLGVVYSLAIQNLSTVRTRVIFFSAE